MSIEELIALGEKATQGDIFADFRGVYTLSKNTKAFIIAAANARPAIKAMYEENKRLREAVGYYGDALEALDKLQYSVEVLCREALNLHIKDTDNWDYIRKIRTVLAGIEPPHTYTIKEADMKKECEVCEGTGKIEAYPESETFHPCDTCRPEENKIYQQGFSDGVTYGHAAVPDGEGAE